jgi:para-nitrobenzyl esterase
MGKRKIELKLPSGSIRGFIKKGQEVFLGVPYAQPPLGELAFRSPQPLKPWEEVKDCCHYPKSPIQGHYKKSCYSEDCLYLNIWVPQGSQNKKKPVIVWIFGGSYAEGGIGKGAFFGMKYDSSDLARYSDCVVVTLNYRLNVFGFLDLSSFSDRFESNLGIKDVIQALRWIKDNIACFNGDNSKVTLAGQSAGAGLIAGLLNCSQAKDLFSSAIMESPVLETYSSKEQSKKFAEEYLQRLGVPPNKPEEIFRLSYQALMKPKKHFDNLVRNQAISICSFNPVVDGCLIEDYPLKKILYGSSKALLIGSNENEAYLFNAFVTHMGIKLKKNLVKEAGEAEADKICQGYPGFPKRKAGSDLGTDVMFRIPKIRYASKHSQIAPTYVYNFAFYSGLFRLAGFKACHNIEIPLLFKMRWMFFCGWKKAEEISHRIYKRYGAFAREGNPNSEGLINWPAYDEKNKDTLIIGKEDQVKENPDKAKIDLFPADIDFFS